MHEHDILEPKLIVNLVEKADGEREDAVIVHECAYEAANRTHLALALSNGYLWLCLYGNNQNELKQLPWFLYGDAEILALSFDNSGKWLIVATVYHLRVVPFLSLLIPSAVSDGSFPTDDIHTIKIPPLLGLVVQTVWWKTFCGQDVAIIGSAKGEVLFIDMNTGSILHSTSVGAAIVRFEMVLDDGLTVKYLLVTCKSNIQWRILLEISDLDLKLRQSVDELHAQGYRGFTHGLYVKSIIAAHAGPGASANEFKPQRFCQFPISVTLSSQFVRGHHLVAAYDKRDHSLRMYDSELQHHPLFVYSLPAGFRHVVCSDYLLYGIHPSVPASVSGLAPASPAGGSGSQCAAENSPSVLRRQQFLIAIVSCKLSEQRAADSGDLRSGSAAPKESHANECSTDSPSALSAVLQTCPLPASLGNVLRCYKHSHPLAWHKELTAVAGGNSSSNSGRGNNSNADASASCCRDVSPPGCTVVDGCLVIAERGVLVLKPRISPESLFCTLCLEDRASAAERLGIALSLDVSRLYLHAGDMQLAGAHVGHAMRLYQLAKCPPIARVRKMLDYGHYHELINYASSLLESPRHAELSAADRKELYEKVVLCHTIVMERSDFSTAGFATRNLRDFLMRTDNISQDRLIAALCEKKLADLLLEIATEKNFIKAALEGIYDNNLLKYVNFGLHMKSSKFRDTITTVVFKDGAAARQFLEPEELGRALLATHVVDVGGLRQIEPRLSELSTECLWLLAQAYDPSGSRCRHHVLCAVYDDAFRQQHRRLLSDTSSVCGPYSVLDRSDDGSTASEGLVHEGSDEESGQGSKDSEELSFLLLVFVKIVIELNCRLSHRCTNLKAFRKLSEEASSNTTEIFTSDVFRLTRRRPLACGSKFSFACVSRSNVLLWSQKHPEDLLIAGDEENRRVNLRGPPPWQCSFFKSPAVKVMTLSCGMQHGVFITTAGVYGWGSSRYGQVGIGVLGRDVTQPELIENFACIDVICGHYHTVAVTADRRLFSWGWAVYGQLGLGTCECVSQPRPVLSLHDVRAAAAGRSHTICLVGPGEVYAFGCSAFGQLGLDDAVNKQPHPTLVSRLCHEPIALIASGSFHNVAVSTSNVVYSWGLHPLALRRKAQALRMRGRGTGNVEQHHHHQHAPPRATVDSFFEANRRPRRLGWSPPEKIVQVCCGASHTLALLADGRVYSWGRNVEGQLGVGSPGLKMTTEEGIMPQHVAALEPSAVGGSKKQQQPPRRVVYLASSLDACMAITSDRRIFAWGRNECRQLDSTVSTTGPGLSKPTTTAEPTMVYRPPAAELAGEDDEWPSAPDCSPLAAADIADTVASGDDRVAQLTQPMADASRGRWSSLPPPPSSVVLRACDEQHYSLLTVAAAAKLYPHSFPADIAQALLLSSEAYGATAAVYLAQHDYPNAIFFHMKCLASCQEHLHAAYYSEVLETIRFYFELLATGGSLSSKAKDVSYLSLVMHCLHMALDENADVSLFENLLMAHAGDVCVHVCTALESVGSCRQSMLSHLPSAEVENTLAQRITSTDVLMAMQPLDPAAVSRFSVAFWARMIEEGAALWEERQRLATAAASPLPPSRPASAANLAVSVDKLWQEVVQNLLKGCVGQRRIDVSSSELRAVLDDSRTRAYSEASAGSRHLGAATAAASSGPLGGSSGMTVTGSYSSEGGQPLIPAASSVSAVAAAFSCGHLLTIDDLSQRAVPELSHALTAAGLPAASCALLTDAYKTERLVTRSFVLACPMCVVHAVLR